MGEIPVRYIVEHGYRVWLRIYWDGKCGERGTYHNAMRFLLDGDGQVDRNPLGGDVDDHPDSEWPTVCEDCGAAVPPMPPKEPCPCGQCGQMRFPEHAPKRQVFRRTLYSTPDHSWIGMPTVGDCYIVEWDCAEHKMCVHGWTNCDGKHVCVRVPDPDPDGHQWDLNGRASNCGSPDDTLHRCWVAHGTPEDGDLHVDKAGLTCNAGGGSIDTGRWHGHLWNGKLVGPAIA